MAGNDIDAGGGGGISGRKFDAFVSSQRMYNDYDIAAKIQEKYWLARQKFLAKIEKKEDECIVLSDAKLDAKLEIYHSIDKSCSKLTRILENYQNYLYIYANEENSLGVLLKECSKHDSTKAGRVMAVVGRSLSQASHERIKLYMPLLRIYQEMETFHSRAVEDTSDTVERLESKRSQYRASLIWMKDISSKLDPDVYSQLDKFRRVQNQVRNNKKQFDKVKMDVDQKIDLLMASRCNLLNQILAAYTSVLLQTFEKNLNNFKSVEDFIRGEDIYEYEFKALKQLNPIQITEPSEAPEQAEMAFPEFTVSEPAEAGVKRFSSEPTLIDLDAEPDLLAGLNISDDNDTPPELKAGLDCLEKDNNNNESNTTGDLLMNELEEIDKSMQLKSDNNLIQL